MRNVDEEGEEKHGVGNALESGRSHESFVGDAVTGLVVDGEEQVWGLWAVTGRLILEDVETVTVDLSVVNSDQLRN